MIISRNKSYVKKQRSLI